MINGKPQLTHGSALTAPDSGRKRAGGPAGGRAGGDFASFLPLSTSGPGTPPVTATPLANGQYAFQAQALPRTQSWNQGDSLSLTASQVRSQAARQARADNMPAGRKSLGDARPQGVPQSRSMMGLSNVGGMLPQPRTQTGKKSPRISGRPLTRRGHIGMEDTRRTGAAPDSHARGRAAGQGRTAAHGPPESLGILQPNRTPLSSLGPDPYTGFAARFQGQGLHQSFVAQGFASQNARAVLKNQGYDLRPARNVRTTAQLLPSPQAGASSAQDKPRVELPQARYPGQSLVPAFFSMAKGGLGSLAAKFESGEEGIAAIGYDRKGGTSYGKYQISSRAGTLDNFISYLREHAPDLAKRLSAAGTANTGSRTGQMPAAWRQIASENPVRFERLQSEFIHTSHFEPAIQGIAQATGVSFEAMPTALREVLFSTAVQHGPDGAVRIVTRAISALGRNKQQKLENTTGIVESQVGRQLIESIYQLRAGQFVSSTARVRRTVKQRLHMEMREALQMLS